MILKHCHSPEPTCLLLCTFSLNLVLFSLGPAKNEKKGIESVF